MFNIRTQTQIEFLTDSKTITETKAVVKDFSQKGKTNQTVLTNALQQFWETGCSNVTVVAMKEDRSGSCSPRPLDLISNLDQASLTREYLQAQIKT
jgi:uncharacterized protein YggU (UPF0235/DUF167 family)